MKSIKVLSILIFVGAFISFSNSSFAQSPAGIANCSSAGFDSQSYIDANFGLSKIGDQTYFGFRFQPELAIGKVGFGLDVPLMFNIEDGSIRTEEFKGGTGALRLIRYVRYGRKKQDPIHVKVGDLTGSYIGFGILVNNYSNSISYEKRKTGISYDILIKDRFGIEGLYSDFDASSLNLLAVRPYFKPFGHTSIPIVKTIEIGATYVTDHDQTASGYDYPTNRFLEDGFDAYSADIGLFFLNTSFIDLTGYCQYGLLTKNKLLENELAKIYSPLFQKYDKGDGISVGLASRMNIIGNVFVLNARIERLWYSDCFIPQFFDAVYEINKDAKLYSLASSEKLQGIYGSLFATLIDKIHVGGSILLPDNVSETSPALLQLSAEAPNLIPKFMLSAHYLKGNIADLSDALVIDENSIATVRVAYKILPFLLAGVDYKWTFLTTEDGSFEADHTIMPYVGLHFPLNF
ncbi:MAG: hypothetical protein HN704_02630 [Bacteroidetes bacterium]|jgi:hypothetical protein|nr:hypothetical protein [Bacteroidota bacterium]MBT6686329.1 hypothetical protein [Bacteroidota bacterium]MBT7142162.1 hypothetical protein [Bacteroidota bacterium]MBT7490483.1 hypothetical protein [Bacteroidota bacterium]